MSHKTYFRVVIGVVSLVFALPNEYHVCGHVCSAYDVYEHQSRISCSHVVEMVFAKSCMCGGLGDSDPGADARGCSGHQHNQSHYHCGMEKP